MQGEINTQGDHQDETSSVDTQEAFLEMLGMTGYPSEIEDDELDEDANDSIDSSPPLVTTCTSIPLPPRCSRYLHPPDICTAFTIDNFYSRQECQQLIEIATTSSRRSFQYITEAAHTAPDGTTYSVQLQNPNPHKLSVFELTLSHYSKTLWRETFAENHWASILDCEC
jgi:hypothetical protein